MTINEISSLKDGTRVVLNQTGVKWGEDRGSIGICVKIGNRLVEADIERPDDNSVWYPYYSINELDDDGYECSVELESNIDICVDYCESTDCKCCRFKNTSRE